MRRRVRGCRPKPHWAATAPQASGCCPPGGAQKPHGAVEPEATSRRSPGGVPASPRGRRVCAGLLLPSSALSGPSGSLDVLRKKPAPHPEAAAPLGLRARTERRGPCLARPAPPVLHHGAFPAPPSLPEPCPLRGSFPLGRGGSLTAALPRRCVTRRRCPVTES